MTAVPRKQPTMFTLYVTLLVVVHWQFITPTASKDIGVNKRSAGAYKVEGCFSSFSISGSPSSMEPRSSNVRCQEMCRDKGFILAATQGNQCHCGNIYPKGKKVKDSECSTRCRSYMACHSPQSCCGGPNSYSVSVVGNIDVAKQILRRLAHKYQTESGYRDNLKKYLKPLNPQILPIVSEVHKLLKEMPPDFTINVKDTDGEYKQCTMNAMDKSAESITYECKALSNRKNMMKLDAASFNIEDKTPPNVGQPKRVAGFRPVICSSHSNKYNCKKSLAVKISTTSSFSIGSGFETSVSIGASVEFGVEAFGVTSSAAFSTEVSTSSSFNVERSTDKTTETSDNTEVSIDVPKNTEIKIDLLRTVEDIVYKWKAVFKLLGKYFVKWANGFEAIEDVTTILTGPDREIYAFEWEYPDTDVLKVVITDKYGQEKASGCDHSAGKGKDSKIKVN